MPSPNQITAARLNRLIGTLDCPIIVDVCIDDDFDEDPHLIPSAFRHPHTDLPGLAKWLAGCACVVTCQKGLKLSQGVAAWLRSDGVPAVFLEGGMYGWRDAPDTMRIPASAVPDPIGGATLWVARHRPDIDAIARAWLIRRFVDRDARFLFVAPSQVAGVAGKFGATPLSADEGFEALRETFQLRSDALLRLAQTLRREAPEASGMLALTDGLLRRFEDDQDMLDASIPILDALYLWARDATGARQLPAEPAR